MYPFSIGARIKRCKRKTKDRKQNQIFVKAENKETVAEFVKNNGGTITTMIRYEVGEGMQKREENFAEEVAKQMQGN